MDKKGYAIIGFGDFTEPLNPKPGTPSPLKTPILSPSMVR